MIDDVSLWKLNLVTNWKSGWKNAVSLMEPGWAETDKTDAPVRLAIEEVVFTSVFRIRKLRDTYSISHELCSEDWPLRRFHLKSKDVRPVFLNFWRSLDFYDLDSPIKESVELHKICNWLIHSASFHMGYSNGVDNLPTHLLFNSDHSMVSIYEIDLLVLQQMVESVTKDQVDQREFISEEDFGHIGGKGQQRVRRIGQKFAQQRVVSSNSRFSGKAEIRDEILL